MASEAEKVERNRWRNMIRRCTDPRDNSFHRYGARGISVCKEWRDSFAAFTAYMGPAPSPRHSIDRIDTNGNYEPGNVRWATDRQQQRNRRNNRRVTLSSGETLTEAEIVERTGLSQGTIQKRILLGWSPDRILSVAPQTAVVRQKISWEQVRVAAERIERGEQRTSVALSLGVSRSTLRERIRALGESKP